jgi:hypothetical protein
VPFKYHSYIGDVPPFKGTAVKVTNVPWQITPAGYEVIPTLTGNVELINTVCCELMGPSQPVAVAVIIVVPVHRGLYVTSPVLGFIVLFPASDAASNEYVIPVLFVAVAW